MGLLCRNRKAKEDFELGGKLVRKGSLMLADILYAKATDALVSAGDHVDRALPAHMDIHRLSESFRPERWLDEDNKLDTSVRGHPCLHFLSVTEPDCLNRDGSKKITSSKPW